MLHSQETIPQIVEGSSMTRVRYLILLSLVLSVSGCFGGRSSLSLPGTENLDESVAILPVTPAHIVLPSDSEEDRVKMAKKTNSVLNTLAGRRKSKLIGPKEVGKLLDKPDLEVLYRIGDQEGDHEKIWKSKKLAEIGERLNLRRIIRIKTEIIITSEESGSWRDLNADRFIFGIRKNWNGRADVIAELYDLSRQEMIGSQRGSAEFWGKEGVGCIPVVGGYPCCCLFPYAVGMNKMHAIDQAAREAIAGVLDLPIENHIDSDPVGE